MHRDARDSEINFPGKSPTHAPRLTALPLTVLAGMQEMAQRVERELAACRRGGTRLAVMLLRFDGLAEPITPSLHQAMVERLRGHLRTRDLIFQLGAEGFGVVLRGAARPHLAAIHQRVQIALNAPYGIGGELHSTVVHVGLVGQPEGLVSGDDLLHAADPLPQGAMRSLNADSV